MQPAELDLPFEEWRDYQKETIEEINSAFKQKDAVILQAPTGSGKTAISSALAKMNDWKTYHLTSTKQLQDQILEDFKFTETIKGRSNYECNAFPGMSCDNCIYSALEQRCPIKSECEYIMQRQRALQELVTVHNYKYFLYAYNYTDFWPEADLMVFDEAHNTEQELMNFIGHKFTYDDFHGEFNEKFPGKDEPEIAIERLENGREVLQKEIAELKGRFQKTLDGGSQLSKGVMQTLNMKKRLLSKVDMVLKNYNKKYWVMNYYRPDTRQKDSDWSDAFVEFKPLFVGRYMKNMINSKKVLFMSATIGDKKTFCNSLGLRADQVRYIEVPSTFKKEKRPFIYKPIGNMSKKHYEDSFPKFLAWLDDFIDERIDDKGIIHTVNYKIASDIYDSSDWNVHMIEHIDSDREMALQQFKEADAPSILLSPSMDTGVDFSYDQARWQVIAKFPFPYLGDKQVRKRMEIDGKWYTQQAVNRLVQTYGRGMRHPDDYCETWMIDETFSRVFNRYKSMFPQWFKNAIAMVKEE